MTRDSPTAVRANASHGRARCPRGLGDPAVRLGLAVGLFVAVRCEHGRDLVEVDARGVDGVKAAAIERLHHLQPGRHCHFDKK